MYYSMTVPIFNYHNTVIKRKRLRDATFVLQTVVFNFVIKKDESRNSFPSYSRSLQGTFA